MGLFATLGLLPSRLLCPWGFSRQEYWSGLLCPSSGDLPTQGLNPGLRNCWQILHHVSHQPKNTGLDSLSLLQGSSRPRNQSQVSCIADRFFISWATREALGIIWGCFKKILTVGPTPDQFSENLQRWVQASIMTL